LRDDWTHPRRRGGVDGGLRGPLGHLFRPPRTEVPAPGRLRGPSSYHPRVRLHHGTPMARPCRSRGRRRGRRLPRNLERDHCRPNDDGAAERGLRTVVHPGKRRRRPGLRSADPLPWPRGVDGPRQPRGPRHGPPGHGRLRVPRPDCSDRSLAELPRDATRPGSAAEGDGLEASPEVLEPNGLIGLGAGFFIPLVTTWLYLKYGVPDT